MTTEPGQLTGDEKVQEGLSKPEEAKTNGHDAASQADPDVHTIVIQFNSKTMQSRVSWPENVKSTCTLFGMLEIARQTLLQNQMIPVITQSAIEGIAKSVQPKGRGMPSLRDILSRKH